MTNPTTEIGTANITSPYVELFTLDCSPIGGSTYYFTPSTVQGSASTLTWQGHTYVAMPITSSGWEVQADGRQPKPSVTLALLNNSTMLTAIKNLGDIIGAKVTRHRTFYKYLDGQSHADPNIHFGADIYIVDQKTAHNNEAVTWMLSSIIDRFGMKLPRRQILRDGDSRNPGFPGVSRYRAY